jgi:hypothetical protein
MSWKFALGARTGAVVHLVVSQRMRFVAIYPVQLPRQPNRGYNQLA